MQILPHLNQLLHDKQSQVLAWLADREAEKAPYLYGSVDLRHSGTKIVPVDANLFPAGFNNLSKAAAGRSAEAAKHHITTHFPQAKNILIVPENHTRNLGYLENVACLRDILANAGFNVEIGTLLPESMTLSTMTGREITEQALTLQNGSQLATQTGFVPDVIVLNNDCTTGIPDILAATAQPIIPPPQMGWHKRRKRVHFTTYDALARDFGDAFDLDPWLISAYFRNCGMVDFRARTGFECVATNVDMVLNVLRVKYAEYNIKEDPYVFIKADSGTYGMGVMTARSGEEVLAMNKKFRQKMDVIKEGFQNTEVLIQEGVPTIDTVNGMTSEPMIYVVDNVAVGGAFRVNQERDAYGNLNAPGMTFHGMCDEAEKEDSKRHAVPNCNFCVYSLIARLATLSTAREEY